MTKPAIHRLPLLLVLVSTVGIVAAESAIQKSALEYRLSPDDDSRATAELTLAVKPRGASIALDLYTRHPTADLHLRVLDSKGELLVEDAESLLTDRPPRVNCEVTEAGKIKIQIIASELEEDATCSIHIVQVQEKAPVLAKLEEPRRDLERAEAARAAGKLEESRRIVDATLQRLLGMSGLEESSAANNLLYDASEQARQTGLPQLESAALERVLAFREKALLVEHPLRVRVQQSLGGNLAGLGRVAEGKKLFDHVLAVREKLYPPEHPAVIGARVNCAAGSHMLGDLEGAKGQLEQVLEIQERTLPEDDKELLLTRQNLAAALHLLGDVRGAKDLLARVLAVQEGSVPESDMSLLRTRMNYASALFLLGHFHEAKGYYVKVLAVLEKIAPAEHPEMLKARGNYAQVIAQLGDVAGAIAIEKKILAIYERTLPKNHSQIIQARRVRAQRLRALGDNYAAKELQEELLEIMRKQLPPDHPDLRTAMMDYSGTLRDLGELGDALVIQEEILEALGRTLPEEHEDLQRARVNLASTLVELGDLGRAKTLTELSIAALEGNVTDHHTLLLNARHQHAAVLMALGDHQSARASFEETVATLEKVLPADHPDVLSAYSNVAAISQIMGDVPRARKVFERVYEARKQSLDDDHPALQAARMNYAGSLQMMGELDKALEVIEPAVAVLERTLPASDRTLLGAKNNLGAVLLFSGKAAEARALFTEILEIEQGHLPPGDRAIRTSRHNVASALVSLGERGQPLVAVLDGMTEDLQRQQIAYLPELSPRQASALAEELHDDIVSLLQYTSLVEGDARSKLDEKVLAAIETSRCADSAARRLARLSPAHGSQQAREVDGLHLAVRKANEAIARLAGTGGGQEQLRKAIREKERAESDLVKLLSQQPGAAPLLQPTTAADLGRRLQPGEAAVGYWTFHEREWKQGSAGAATMPGELERTYVAFVVRHDGSVTRVDLGAAEKLDRRVQAWRTLVRKGKRHGDRAMAKQASELRKAILDPVFEATGEIERLYVALDESLHLVALDALPGDKDDQLVGDDTEIHVVTALRDLLLIDEGPLAAPSLLAAGAIDYQRSSGGAQMEGALAYEQTGAPADVLRGGGFEPLPASGDEVEAVAAIYGEAFAGAPAALLTGVEPTRKKILEQLRGARYLHLATHAWFAPDDVPSTGDRTRGGGAVRGVTDTLADTVRGYAPMLLCGVALVGAAAQEDGGGILTAQEISGLDLSGCELAVLSACETSLGSRRPGQGVASLQQALHAAGVRLSLTSLWKVPDAPTRLLMEEFYQRLWQEGQPAHQALWEAKQVLREKQGTRGKPLYTPRDWAGWGLSGTQGQSNR